MIRKYGITSAPLEVPTVEPDPVKRNPYNKAVLSSDQCHAHKWGTALLISGTWYWRNQLAQIVPLFEGNRSEGLSGLPDCHCPLT